MQSLRIEIGAEIKSPNGRITRQLFRPCNSLVKGFIQILMAQTEYNVQQTIKDTSGTNRTDTADKAAFRSAHSTTSTTYGILIGVGTTPVTIDDYNLASKITTSITHNNGTAALEHPDANTWRLALSRGFANNTGSIVHIKEVGLIGKFGYNAYDVLLDRTLYDVDIPISSTLTMTYRISVTI